MSEVEETLLYFAIHNFGKAKLRWNFFQFFEYDTADKKIKFE